MKWDRLPLEALCANSDDIRCGPFGTQLNKDEFREEGVPLWGIKQVNASFSIPTKEFVTPKTAKRLSQYDLLPGDLVMTRKGTVGNCAVYPPDFEPGVMHSDLLRMRTAPGKCDTSFLVHQLHHSKDVERQLSLISGGAIMPGINVGRLKRLEVVVPPLAEQKRIARILDAADALRAKRRESLAQLDSLLQSTFLDLFGDPVSNPMGWGKVSIGEIVENIDSGWSPSCLDRPAKEEEWGVLKLGAVTYCTYRDDQTKALPADLTPRPEIEVRQGDLLFARKNTYDLVAACAYVHATRPKLLLPDLIFRLRLSNTAKAEPIFMWQQLIVPRLRKHIQSFAGGAAGSMPNISKAKLRTIEVILPPLPLQRRFAAIVESVERQKARQRAHLAELDALFASLQHRAFRGEL